MRAAINSDGTFAIGPAELFRTYPEGEDVAAWARRRPLVCAAAHITALVGLVIEAPLTGVRTFDAHLQPVPTEAGWPRRLSGRRGLHRSAVSSMRHGSSSAMSASP